MIELRQYIEGVKMKNCLDHLCIVVRSVSAIQEFFINKGLEIEEIKINGDVKEYYVDNKKGFAGIRFVELNEGQVYKDFPLENIYGIHHLAIVVENIKEFLKEIQSTVWYLHPMSISTYEKFKRVWLSKEGAPFLLEIIEDPEKSSFCLDKEGFINEIFFPESTFDKELVKALNTKELKEAKLSEWRIRVDDVFFTIEDFYDEIN